MFTEGLDSNALRWVRENQKEDAFSSSSLRPRADQITNIRNSRGFVLPPTAKFRSGHLPPTAIPVSRTIPNDVDDSGSASENDITTESDEDDVYGGRYSLDSSPQDERIPNSTTMAPRYGGNVGQRSSLYAGDYVYSDVSSSVETMTGIRGNLDERLGRVNGRISFSSEFSTTQVSSVNGSLPRSKLRDSEGYASSVPSRANVESLPAKVLHSRNIQNQQFSHDEDVPSAPPFSCHAQAIKESPELASEVSKTAETPYSRDFPTNKDLDGVKSVPGNEQKNDTASENPAHFVSIIGANPARLPAFHASALGPWHAVIAYDGCVRLCLQAWAGVAWRLLCSFYLNTSVQHVLLQSEDELLEKRSSEQGSELTAPKPKRLREDEVRKVKAVLDPPTGCNMSSLSLRHQRLKCSTENPVAPCRSAHGSISRQSLAYVHASTQYLKQVSGLLKTGVTSLRNSSSSYEVVQEIYSCLLRLKSSTEEDAIRMQPGSGETHVFFPDSIGDDLIVEVQDSKGNILGVDKLRWWSIYREPEHELVGKLQLYINYATSSDDCNLKIQQFQQRNLLLYGSWKWLLNEFASYYGVSEVYTKLRYLSYIMDVATPTADCLTLVHDLLMPVIMKGNSKSSLSHQENRILGEIKDQIEQILALVFENYKSLDESSHSGIMDVFKPATGIAAPALDPAVKLYTLLHDVLTPEAQTKLTQYLQTAARKRSRRHLTETDEYVANNNEGFLMDSIAMSTAYQKMASLCMNLKNEIHTDIEIHNQHILPSFPACTAPTGPSPPVTELVIATADFQRDLASWSIVDAKELFHLYIMLWIQDKRHSLLESCKLDKVKWSGVRTQHSTTPFVDGMYDRLRETLNDYEVIICRWPEYVFVLESAVADIEKAIVEALDKQYADVLAPLKDNLAPKKFGFNYVKKLTKRSVCSYTVPDELGILLNSMKRMLDVLRPKVEARFKSWGSCIPDGGNAVPGERLSEVTVMLRTKFRSYLQAIMEKLVENTKLLSATKLKKILQESKESVSDSDIRGKMQPLKEQLTNIVTHLHSVFETHVFIAICRGYWDRMGLDVLSFLENRKENKSWYKGTRIAVSVLDDTFGSQMQQLLGNALQDKDLEPPRSIMEVRSMLCKDAPIKRPIPITINKVA
ncbi:hypothetical protein K2173_012487 [Erythroxylum novogranatense]|uniref:Uncharacterized protein n=1 Tax=Erythroxylum novogranatense TaxID=1862640 RepID=A0AAV8S5T2_9ROSI|nr:hypothetical protein K2173_012487 [Erythroxylum novogranatense]